MSDLKKITIILLSMAAIMFLPWLGAYFYHHGTFPPGYFAYPPLEPIKKPQDFNLPIFILFAFGCAVFTAVYLIPRLFGFKPSEIVVSKPVAEAKLPVWFWVGLLAWGLALFVLATHMREPKWFIHWSDFPLFWGFSLMLDGWVYKRNGGRSILSVRPQELFGIGVASISGWMIFEFLNFFIDDNWYYPWGNIIDREEFLLYACIISSGLLPLAFEWYCLFKTFPKLNFRFTNGPKIVLGKGIKLFFLLLALFGMFISSFYPNILFFVVWVSPPVILALVLNYVGVWTPLDPIGKGNWGPTLLSALTYFVTGFCLEGQNYLSAVHDGQKVLYTGDPAYWQYSLPFVNVWHVFEMPLLGFYGYLPFGVYCWLWWIAMATLLNVPAIFLKEDPLE